MPVPVKSAKWILIIGLEVVCKSIWRAKFTDFTTKERTPAVDAERAGQGGRCEGGEDGDGAEVHDVFPGLGLGYGFSLSAVDAMEVWSKGRGVPLNI